MLSDWATHDQPSVEDFSNGLFSSHFKIPVSPAAFNALSHVCEPGSLSNSGDCIIVSKISSFLLSFSSTAGELRGICSYSTVCSQWLSSSGKTEAHTIIWVANLMDIMSCLDLARPTLGLDISVDSAEKKTRTTTPVSQVGDKNRECMCWAVCVGCLCYVIVYCVS